MKLESEIHVAGKIIGSGHLPFVVAEMSGNHNQSLERALKIVDAAAAAGVQAVKIQTFTADTMTLDLNSGEFFVSDPDNLWKGKTLYQLYQEAHTPWEWHQAIFDRCRSKGIFGFSTPFDETAVDFLESLNVPLYKIASFENIDLPLIKKVASTGKPVIISTGMASLDELTETVETARSAGCKDLILLKATSTYPATEENSHLLTIPHLRELFHCQAGLSDHTMGIGVAVASVALGATVIEKHFTLSRAEGGVDSAFSMEPHEMKELVVGATQAWRALGQVHYGPTPSEERSLRYRRSLYVAKDMRAGETFNKENLRVIRPGLGLPPKHYEELLGKKVKRSVKKGTPVNWDLCE